VAMTTDPTAAAAGVADPMAAAAAAYLNLTQTGAEALPAGSDAVSFADGSRHHHHHHHHHRRRLTALLNTDELPSPWKVSAIPHTRSFSYLPPITSTMLCSPPPTQSCCHALRSLPNTPGLAVLHNTGQLHTDVVTPSLTSLC
jgi:hypothetical protein